MAYDLVIDEVVASGPIVVVPDSWTQTLRLSASKKVKREIRESEFWRCQPDGHWRIARYVSAPEQEPWLYRSNWNNGIPTTHQRYPASMQRRGRMQVTVPD